ncbi:MAG: hypothetical protein J6L60_05650 [Bacteroidaceae bacterium]|nr:hypothetical protein [Bacteroidaceae bacterium]
MSMDKCKVCGGDLNLSDSFCPKCGFEHHILPEPVSNEVRIYEEKRIKACKKVWEEHNQGVERFKKNYEAEVSKNKTLEDNLKEEKAKTRAQEQEKERYRDQVDKTTEELATAKEENQGLVDKVQRLTSQNQSLKREIESLESSTCKAGELSFKEMNGIKYCGDISVDNERSGFGICKNEDESYYVGEWKLDMRNGVGMEVNSVNSKYVGEWNFNRKNGIGTTIQTDGIRYSGEWKNGKMHGLGTLFFPNGERLCARFSNGLLQQGTGVYYLQDGSCIIGYMTMNGPDGKCLHYKKDGSYENEIWNNGIKY